MKKSLAWLVMLLMIFTMFSTSVVAMSGTEPITETSLEPAASFEPNGEYNISIFKDGKWETIATLTFDRFMRERQLDIGPYIKSSGNVNMRITQKSGGSAYVDSAFLGNAAPVKTNSYDTSALMKLSATDDDIIKVDTEGIALEYEYPVKGSIFKIRARIENEIISKIPFQFPLENRYRQINEKASFYTYRLDSIQETASLDGVLSETLSKGTFFKEFVRPGSGHPAGFVYGWVMNDDENLYVLMDVTPDNTFDGDKDYAKVYIKTTDGIKEFKISVPETAWGRPDFTYTDNVVYQHKIYEFKIPFSKIGITRSKLQSDIELCFSAYGTAALMGFDEPALAYNSRDNRYLSVFMLADPYHESVGIYGEFVDANGVPVILDPDASSPFTTVFPIADYSYMQQNPSVAYDSINNRFLVVWSDSGSSDKICGQLLNADGSPYGPDFYIDYSENTPEGTSQYGPKISFDSTNGNFLVIWEDDRNETYRYDIYGRILKASGGFLGSSFAISKEDSRKIRPAVSFDGASGNFLVAWADDRVGPGAHIYGHMVNGTAPVDSLGNITGSDFLICGERTGQSNVAAAYNNLNSKFIVTWNDWITVDDHEKAIIYGRIVNSSGMCEGAEFIIAGVPETDDDPCQHNGEVAFDSSSQNFLFNYEEHAEFGSFFYGSSIKARYVDADNNTPQDIVDVTAQGNFGEQPALAYNSTDCNFLSAHIIYVLESWISGSDIIYKVIGEKSTPPAPYLTGIKFEPDTYSLTTGQSKQTVVKAVYSDGSTRGQITEGLIFTSDDTDKVSIDSATGVITGLIPASGVTIRAQYGSPDTVLRIPGLMTASALVTVTAPGVTPTPTPIPTSVPLPTAPPRVPVGEIIVDGVVLQSIYEDDIDKSKDLFSFIEYKDGQSARLWLKGDFYNRLLSGKKDPALEFKWDGITYTLPLKCVDVTATANELAINPFSARFNLVIEKVKDEDAAAARKAAKELGAQIIGGLTNFKVEITGEFSNAKKQIDSYNLYVTRTVNLSGGTLINTNNTSGMKYLPDAGKFTFAPSVFGVYNGSRAITIKYRGNGSYAILKYPVSFNDISGHWGLKYIEKMASRLIASAEKGDAYAPDEKITRGEFAAMLAKAMGITEEGGNKAFEDIKDQWYAKDVIAVANANIISGRNDGKFYPEDYILREEMAVMVYRALEFAAIPVNEYEIESVLGMFKDRSKISSYAVKEAAVCAKTGIIIGRANGDFAPSENATRAEAAAIIERMLKFLEFINK